MAFNSLSMFNSQSQWVTCPCMVTIVLVVCTNWYTHCTNFQTPQDAFSCTPTWKCFFVSSTNANANEYQNISLFSFTMFKQTPSKDSGRNRTRFLNVTKLFRIYVSDLMLVWPLPKEMTSQSRETISWVDSTSRLVLITAVSSWEKEQMLRLNNQTQMKKLTKY